MHVVVELWKMAKLVLYENLKPLMKAVVPDWGVAAKLNADLFD
jgi:hypothetical protein